MKKKKNNFRHILFYVFLIAAVVLICASLFRGEALERMQYSDVVAAFEKNEVKSFEIDKNNVLTMTFDKGSEYAKFKVSENKDGTVNVQYRLASLSIFHADLGDTITDQMAAGTLKGEYVPPAEYAAWLSYLPIILIVVTLIVMYIIMTKQLSGGGAGGGKMGMGSFSKARA